MSEHTKLQVFEKTIAVPGCNFTSNALIFSQVNEESLVSAGAFLQAVDQCSAWWWGDFLAAYCGYRLKADECDALDEPTKVTKIKQYGAHYAAICGKDPHTLSNWKAVADFYNSVRRRTELSWSHHAEAKEGSDGDAAVADNWLDLAVKHKWSRSELRAAIRRSKRLVSEPDEPLPQTLLPLELVEARRYATAALKRVDAMEMKEIAVLLDEIKPVIEFANALASRLTKMQTPAGKESFSNRSKQR